MSSIPQRARVRGIYSIRHIVSGRIYIGSSSDIHGRWNDHRSYLIRGCHKNTYLQHAWNKYGESAFVFEVLEEVTLDCDLQAAEQRWIDATPRRYNINPRADLPPSQRGVSPRAETREKLRQTSTGRPKTEATREKLRQANLGKKRSAESIENQRRAIMGRTLTQEHRENIRRGALGKNTGRKATEETRERLRQSHLGKSNGPRSEETKEKIRQGHLRRKREQS